MSLSALAIELDLTDEELDSIPLEPQDLQESTGNSGDMVYEYYFYVPDSTPVEILKKKGWAVGECVYVSRNVFDEPEEPEE
ncbi:hypothetical protein [Ewingella americana]|nr:hypothetical protein [Ewingella americana]KAA8726736.1 hypothetical protein F4W05_17885 [Ewingella americana]STS10354.1 Uncharacterised protein [Ewingella americana]